MVMKIAIHQPNFLPWIGYFHKIANVDKFVLLDDVQLPRGKSFCSRTKILISSKESWLTIPILGKSDKMLIKDTRVNNTINWKRKHLKTIELNYKKAKFFGEIFPIIEEGYNIFSDYLIYYNILFVKKISSYLNINVEFFKSSEISPESRKSGLERIIEICKYLNVTSYLSGSGAGSKRYIKEEEFRQNGIKLEWDNFKFSKYNQINTSKFISGLSIIDLLFNCGKDSKEILQSGKN